MTCYIVEEFTVVLPDDTERCLAKTCSTLLQSHRKPAAALVGDRLDNIKNLARCRLIFERLLQFGRAFLYLVE